MKFLLLIYGDTATRGSDQLVAELVESGEWIGGHAFADPLTGRTVRVLNGVAEATAGTLAAVTERLAGYGIVDCEGLERATAIAARIRYGGFCAVEVRPVMDPAGLEM